MSFKEKDFYTVNISDSICDQGINVNTPQCPHLLPCGICSLTNRQCPNHWGRQGDWSPVVWDFTCNTKE